MESFLLKIYKSKFLIKKMKINSEKIHLIYNPIDKPINLIPLGNEKTRQFIYVGRVQYEKQKI